MKYQKIFLLSVSCFFLAFLCSIIWGYKKDENLADRIAPSLLRFHVLANSNTNHDQTLKTEVKSLLLEKLNACPADSKEMFCSYIEKNRYDLERYVDTYLESQGCHYQASISITQAYFPTKAYGNLVLPCGTYDTVQVRLGEGRGRNWWCVLYPRLCFIDATHAFLPDESVQELKQLLSEEDCSALMDTPSQVHFRLKLLEFIK